MFMRLAWLTLVAFAYCLTSFAQDAKTIRLANATSICESKDQTIEYSRELKNFTSQPAFRAMNRAMEIASFGLQRLTFCEHADLVVKFHADFTEPARASIVVTDADSGDVVFSEERNSSDMSNDLFRLAKHFQLERRNAKPKVEVYRIAHAAGCQDDDIASALAQEDAAELLAKINKSYSVKAFAGCWGLSPK
jgi:hypothetical protein